MSMNEYECLHLAAVMLSGRENYYQSDFKDSDVQSLFKIALQIKEHEADYLQKFKEIDHSSHSQER